MEHHQVDQEKQGSVCGTDGLYLSNSPTTSFPIGSGDLLLPPGEYGARDAQAI